MEKRQRERQAREHATDERKRPKGIRGLFARITGRKQKVEAEIAEAQRARLERNRVEWEKLEARQIEQREKMVSDMQRVFEQEKLLFRVEAKRIHERTMQPDRSLQYTNDPEREVDRDEDDGRDDFGGPPGPKLSLDPPRR